jgi:hypothetical protein
MITSYFFLWERFGAALLGDFTTGTGLGTNGFGSGIGITSEAGTSTGATFPQTGHVFWFSSNNLLHLRHVIMATSMV